MSKYIVIVCLLLLIPIHVQAVGHITLEWDASSDLPALNYRVYHNSPMADHLLLSQTGRRVIIEGDDYGQPYGSIIYNRIDFGVLDSIIYQPFCQGDYGCLFGYKVYYWKDGVDSDYGGIGADQGDSPVHAGNNLGMTITGLDGSGIEYCFVATAYINKMFDDLLESNYSNEECGYPVTSCGNGECDAGECISGCTADCSVEDCCGIEGCNTAIGETAENCAGDCGGGAPGESGAPNLSSVGCSGVTIH